MAARRRRPLRFRRNEPAPRQLPGARFALHDPDYRFVVAVDRAVPPERRSLPTETDGVVPLDHIGRVESWPASGRWTCGGWPATAAAVLPGPGRHHRHPTRGDGRYVPDTVTGADLDGDADVVVDLTLAYQPSCA